MISHSDEITPDADAENKRRNLGCFMLLGALFFGGFFTMLVLFADGALKYNIVSVTCKNGAFSNLGGNGSSLATASTLILLVSSVSFSIFLTFVILNKTIYRDDTASSTKADIDLATMRAQFYRKWFGARTYFVLACGLLLSVSFVFLFNYPVTCVDELGFHMLRPASFSVSELPWSSVRAIRLGCQSEYSGRHSTTLMATAQADLRSGTLILVADDDPETLKTAFIPLVQRLARKNNVVVAGLSDFDGCHA